MRKFKDGFWLVMQCKSAKFTLILGRILVCERIFFIWFEVVFSSRFADFCLLRNCLYC